MAFRCFTLLLGLLSATALGPASTSLLAQSAAKAQSQLVLLDGSSVAFQSLAIQEGKLSGTDIPVDLTLDDLRRIELAGKPGSAAAKPSSIVELRGGGKIFATSVTVVSEKCRIEWSGGDPLSPSFDLVRAIRFDPATASAEFEKALATPSAELDRVFIKNDTGKLSSIVGLIDSLDAEQLTIAVDGQDHRVPRAKLFGIVVAQPAANELRPRCLISFRDGSTLGGVTLSLAGDRAAIGFPAGGAAEFAWSAAAHVTIRSRRVAFLSDLKPIAEEQQAIVTLPQPAQRDKSVWGKPLTLGSRTYEKGLGVHARSSLTFATEKKWDTLAATIGLDAEASGKGDCVFVVLADGETVLTRPMKGNQPPEEIQLSIAGRDQITLVVEPGDGLDLADHADWCDARLIKNRE
jgi:NPCBM/NEW2 domain-containing protein